MRWAKNIKHRVGLSVGFLGLSIFRFSVLSQWFTFQFFYVVVCFLHLAVTNEYHLKLITFPDPSGKTPLLIFPSLQNPLQHLPYPLRLLKMRAVGGKLKGKECLFRRLKQFKIAFRQGIGNRVVIPAVQKVNGNLRPVYLPVTGDHDPEIELRLRGSRSG